MEKKKVIGTAAVSAAALASLLGASSARADDVCIVCPSFLPGSVGRDAALNKMSEDLAQKIAPIFYKIDQKLAGLFDKF